MHIKYATLLIIINYYSRIEVNISVRVSSFPSSSLTHYILASYFSIPQNMTDM